jgi:hypothetical protein
MGARKPSVLLDLGARQAAGREDGRMALRLVYLIFLQL